MYATASSYPTAPAARGLANAYRQVEVQTGVDAASPHRLVTMLFDGLLDALAQARGAVAAGDIAQKAGALGRAVRIVDEGLKSALDTARGGALARDLGELYGYITLRLTYANLRNDTAAMDECKRLVEPLREAWLAIGDSATRPAR